MKPVHSRQRIKSKSTVPVCCKCHLPWSKDSKLGNVQTFHLYSFSDAAPSGFVKVVYYRKNMLVELYFDRIQASETVVMIEYYMVTTLVWKTNCIREVEEEAAQFILQPQYLNYSQNICEGVITNALESCSKKFPCS